MTVRSSFIASPVTTKLPLFVVNRVKTIREAGFDAIKYCPSKDNPSDLLTLGVNHSELSSNLWRHGPTWLEDGDWPICQLFKVSTSTATDPPQIVDTANSSHTTTPAMSINASDQQGNTGIASVITISKFNSLDKLLRVTAYILRFVDILKHRHDSAQPNSTQVTTAELLKAEKCGYSLYKTFSHENEMLLTRVQHDIYPLFVS